MASASPIVLASGSAARRQLLDEAGVPFVIRPADIDERAIRLAADRERQAAGAMLRPLDAARLLAEAKAVAVSRQEAGAIVLGSDQVLDLAGEIFDKPVDLADARHHLRKLSGRTHTLHSAVAIVRDGVTLWAGHRSAYVTMRPLTDSEIDAYLGRAGDAVLGSVGAYQIEHEGSSLFVAVDGDRETIMGLPIEPVIAALQELGVLEA